MSLDEEVEAAVACKSKGSPRVPAERRGAGRPRPFGTDGRVNQLKEVLPSLAIDR